MIKNALKIIAFKIEYYASDKYYINYEKKMF